jgi:hypothetical protein
MTSQDHIRLTPAMIFGADSVLAWGPSSAWLDARRPAPPLSRALAGPPALITAFVEPG